MNLLIPKWHVVPEGVAALSTLRSGGISVAPYDDGSGIGTGGLNLGLHVGDDPLTVAHNRMLLRQRLPRDPVWLNQVHGNRVVEATTIQGVPEADASFTTQPGVVCAIMTADCMPVLMCDRAGKVVAAAHAGWRGLAGGVLENTVNAMREAGASELMAWLGPAIGPARFEVGEDVRAAFAHLGEVADSAFSPIVNLPGKYLANLPVLVRLVLARSGVTAITGGTDCTVSDPAHFYSFRRDKITGRMATLIWIN